MVSLGYAIVNPTYEKSDVSEVLSVNQGLGSMSNKSGKNIVICLDGTGCQLRENNTNVVKLYRVLECNPDQQIKYYDPGVGTLGDPDYKTPLGKQVTRILGMAFGRGIIRNVEEAYSFLMEHYQEGDHIYIFGFSRGAYTARALAAFIYRCGLLESGCQNLIPYGMKLFRSRPSKSKFESIDSIDKRTNKWFRSMGKFKKTYSRNCPIHFLGLWDSVKTFGWIYDPIYLPNTTNNPSINTVRHALAIDERRTLFQKMPWGEKPKDVKQVWFVGVHGDIGGGFLEEESGLAKIALKWMIEEALKSGLCINEKEYKSSVLGEGPNPYVAAPDPLAKLHKSLVGLWRPLQFVPRMMWDVDKGDKGGEVLKFPDRIRKIPKKAVLHTSVLERLKSGDYRPRNLELRTYEPSHVQEALLEKEYSFEPPL